MRNIQNRILLAHNSNTTNNIQIILIAHTFNIYTYLMLAGIFQIYSSMLNGVLTITQKEGPLGLYRGIIPAMSQIAPQIGLQFGFYALLKEIWQGITNEHGSNISGNLESINNFFLLFVKYKHFNLLSDEKKWVPFCS